MGGILLILFMMLTGCAGFGMAHDVDGPRSYAHRVAAYQAWQAQVVRWADEDRVYRAQQDQYFAEKRLRQAREVVAQSTVFMARAPVTPAAPIPADPMLIEFLDKCPITKAMRDIARHVVDATQAQDLVGMTTFPYLLDRNGCPR